MKKLLTLFLLCGMTLWAEQPTVNDAELTKKLLGTWVTDPSDKISDPGTVTYHADGTGEDVIHVGKGTDVKIVRLTTRWSVKDGKLCLDCVTSSNHEIVPIGLKLKDIIISISNERLVLEAFEGYGSGKGTRAIQVRRPAPKKGEQPGAGQPATQPADKNPVKVQPSTPTSKDAPR